MQRQPTANELKDKQLMRLIQAEFDKGRKTYGTRRIKQALAQQGITVRRRRIGWSMAERMQAVLVNDALSMAIWKRKPARGLIWHTDRGSQYASDSHRRLLAEHDIVQSMSRKGDFWDNAVAESFFHSLKTELVHHETYLTCVAAKQSIFEYIEVFYNRQRLHSGNGYLSLVDYELQHKAA